MEKEKKRSAARDTGAATVSMPHDKGYKKSLQNPGEFLHFLKKYVGADWMMALSEEDLAPCDKEMLERDYEGKEADLIYRVQVPGGKEAILFILQELQSAVDYTMVFRILVYVVNTLVKHFLETDRKEREREEFRLPAMVPIVFYNGQKKWTAARSLGEYQNGGELFGSHILNLEYYLVELSRIGEEYILSTNTVLDNIMYCDKYRKQMELADAVRRAYGRVKELGLQEREEFRNWAKYILLSVCGDKEAVAEEILRWTEDGREERDMFEYNAIAGWREEQMELRAEGKAGGILDLLGEYGSVPDTLQETIMAQKDLEILTEWLKIASRAGSLEEFERRMVGESMESREGDMFEYNAIAGWREERIEIREEGKAEGKAEARVEAILDLLEEYGTVPDSLKERVRTQRNLDVLRQWFKAAVKAGSIEAFERLTASDEIADRA